VAFGQWFLFRWVPVSPVVALFGRSRLRSNRLLVVTRRGRSRDAQIPFAINGIEFRDKLFGRFAGQSNGTANVAPMIQRAD
jgi:hypothetical protein